MNIPKKAEGSAVGTEAGRGHNSALSRQHNRGLVLQLIATGVCGSRTELARATGLTKMTVTNIIAGFIAQGLVEECAEKQARACGRSPIRLRLTEQAPRVAGLLICRDRIQAVLCTLTLEVLKQEEVSFLSPEPERLKVYSCEVLDRLLAGEGDVAGIGVSSAVPADVTAFLEQRYRLPVTFGWDGSGAALAEKRFGAGQEVQDLIFLGISDQITAGIINGGAVYRSGRAQLGHVSIDRDGPMCSCGGRGCLELYASTPVVLDRLCRAARRKMRFPQFCRLSGVAEIEQIMAEMVSDIAVALMGVVSLLHPELIVLGGDCVDWNERHMRMLEETLNRAGSGALVPVRRARFGREAPLVGAAAIAADRIFQGELIF